MELSLPETDTELLDIFECRLNDSIDADLLVYLTDSSCFDHQKLQVIIPEAAKYFVFNAVSTKHELVFGTNLREISSFWSETLDMIRAKDDPNLHCPSHQYLQRAFFVWMYEAWKKRLNNEYLTPQENTMLDLAHLKKALLTEHFDYDENNVNHLSDNIVEISEVSFESMIQDLLGKFKIVQAKNKLVKTNKSISRKKIFDQNPFFAISKMTKNQCLNWEKV